MKSTNFNFPQTFRPESQYLCALLEFADDHEQMSIRDISKQTGVPTGASSGKVKPHIEYLRCMGLITVEMKDGLVKLRRTALGNEVLEQDPGFMEQITLLLCHGMLCRNRYGADLWNYMLITLLPKYHGNISVTLACKEMQDHFSIAVSKKNFSPFRESYKNLFDPLGIVIDKDDAISTSPFQWNDDELFAFGYLLDRMIEEAYPGADEITETQLNALCFGKIFGMNKQQEFELLDALANDNIIRLNRQLVPYTCRVLIDSQSLISKLYSRLC